MGLFKKKADPISERTRALNEQIAALESQIKQLSRKTAPGAQPRVRSTALPHGAHSSPPHHLSREPVFESIKTAKSELPPGLENTAAHYNDLGVRKYDVMAAWRRLQAHFRGPPAGNAKLVSYLAAGSIKGLRPLRYEKRIARNRFLALSLFFVLLLWGIFYSIFRGH